MHASSINASARGALLFLGARYAVAGASPLRRSLAAYWPSPREVWGYSRRSSTSSKSGYSDRNQATFSSFSAGEKEQVE